MPTDNSGDGRPLEPALPASPFESTPSAAGKKKSLIFALAAVLTVTALGGGGYFGYGYMQKSREIANEDGAVAAGAGGRGIVAEVRAMVSAGNARKDVLEKASGFVSNNPESSEVAELQAFVEPLVEEELRDLRKAQIDQELSQWETRSKELQAEQQQRQAALDEQRRQEAEARRVAEQERRVREQRDREIAALKATQNDLRIQSIELCREKRYAEAKLLHVPMAESSEPEFSRWAVNRLKCLEYAEKAFSLVANSKEMLKGRPFPVPNQPRPGTIQYISRRTIEVSYKIRELQGGDFIEKTETVNIPLTAVKGPQMWQLCDGAWDQNDKTELQLMFGAYLLSDGSFLSEARKKLEESNSPNVTAAMLKEIEELEPLLKQRQWETHMQKLTALVDQGNAKEAVRFAKQLKDYYPDLYAQQEREIERLLRLK